MVNETLLPATTAFNQFLEELPLSFRLLNDKHEEKIYLENKPSAMLFEITNNSSQTIYLIPQDSEAVPGPDHYHFKLRFRPGILHTKPEIRNVKKLIRKGWLFMQHERPLDPAKEISVTNPTTAVLYFLQVTNTPIERGKSINLPINDLVFIADQGTQVELSCNNLTTDRDFKKPLKSHFRHFDLTIVNHRGNPTMPIHVAFTDLDTILNDGGSSNSLTLRITNLQKKTPENPGTFTLSHRKHSKMFLYFDTDLVENDFALGNSDSVSHIQLAIRHPAASPTASERGELMHVPLFQGDTPIWELFPEDGDVVLEPHLSAPANSDSFDINLSNIITSFKNGITHLYLRFENIPGYWDHTYAIPIVKQPLIIKGENVGIGEASPQNKLDIKGGLAVGESFAGNISAPANGAIIEGNMGIGTASPSVRLEVNGDIKFSDNGQISSLDDNHRILFRRSENKMELREFGDIVFSPGATSGNETSRMVINSNGNVGIDTGNPINKLDIKGALAVGTTYAGSHSAPIDSVIIEGNVGIKTPNPTNQLSLGQTHGKKLAVYNDSSGKDFYGFGISDATLEIHAGSQVEQLPSVTIKKDGSVQLANNGFSVARQDSQVKSSWNNVAFGLHTTLLSFVGRVNFFVIEDFRAIYFSVLIDHDKREWETIHLSRDLILEVVFAKANTEDKDQINLINNSSNTNPKASLFFNRSTILKNQKSLPCTITFQVMDSGGNNIPNGKLEGTFTSQAF